MRLSIIIPTLNEASHLRPTLHALRESARGHSFELIVSDCNSPDGTADLAQTLGATVVRGSTSRATALNRGADAAGGDVLLFLHADTKLPAGFVRRIERAMQPTDVVGGAFEFRFRGDKSAGWLDKRVLEFVVVANRIRYRWGRGFFGDQAIFVRQGVFESLGGFPRLALLEDLRFSQALSRVGRTAIINPPARTSPRRFLRRGAFRQLLQDWTILGYDSFGVSPQHIWDHYNAHNHCDASKARWLSLFSNRAGVPSPKTSKQVHVSPSK